MIVILAQPVPRDLSTVDFSDLTPIAVVGYPVGDGGTLPAGQHIEFASDLDNQTLLRVKLRAEADVNTQAMQDRIFQAIAANNAWLNRTGTPTLAQTVAQVDRLTKECTALIRMMLTIDDSTSGT